MKSFKFYLDASNYFLNVDNYSKLSNEEKEYNHISSVLLAWASLEAYINALCESLSKGTRLTPLEKAFLNELEYYVDDEGNIKQKAAKPSTSKKILFLLQNFSKKSINKFKQTELWKDIKDIEELRNRILHYKEKKDINVDLKRAQKCRDVAKEAIYYFNKTFR